MEQIARADPEVASNIPVTWPYISRPDPVALIGSSYLDSPLNPLILYSPREDVHLETTSMLLPAQDLDSIQPKEDIQLVSSVLCPVDNDLGFNIVQEAPSNASTVLYQASGNASDEGSITSHALETSSVVSGYTQESFEAISCCKIRLMCSFGGKILPRPSDGKLRYVGGDTRIINVNRNIKYMDLRNKMLDLCEQPLIVKYQLPEEDLDSLVSVTTDEDVENMMEEYDRLEVSKDGSARLRIFLFFAAASEHEPKEFYDTLESSKHSEQQFVDAVNEIPDVVFTKHTRNATAELKVGLNVLPPSSLLSSGIMSQVSYPKYVFPEDWGRDLHNLKPVPYLLGPNTQDHIAADLLPWHDQSFSDESVYQKDDSLAHRALCCQYGCANSSFPGTNDPTTSEELFNMVPLQGQGRECGAIRARPVHGIGLGSSCLDVSCIEPQLHPSLAQSPPALSNRVLWAVEGQCQLSTYQGNHVGGFIQHQKVLSEVPSVSCDLHHAAIASHACQTGPSTTPYHVLSETSHHGACPVMQQQQVFATNPLMSARPRSEIHHGRAFHDCSHCMMPMQPTSSYFRTENALSRHRELPNACNVEVVQEMPISYKTVHGSGTKNLVSGGNDMIMEPTKEYNDCQSQMQALREATDRPISSPFEHAGCHNDSVCDISHGSCIYFSPRDQNTRMQQNEYLVGHPRGQTSVSPRASDGSYNHVVHTLPPLKQSLERSSEASVMPRPGVELNKGMIFGSSISHQETILPSEARVDKTAELEGCKIPKMEESASEVGDLAPCDLASGLIERDKGLVKEDTHSMISERTCDDSLVGKLCSNSMVTKDTSICIMQSAKSTNDLNYTTSTPVVEASGDVQLETEIGATDRKVETCDVHVTSSLNITPSSNGSLAPNMGKLSITNNASVAANSSLNGEPLGHMNTFAAETDDKDLQDNVISDFNVHSAIPSEGKHASVIVNSDEKGADQGKVVKTIEDNQTKGGGDAQVPTMASTIIENNLEIPSAVTEAEAIAHGFQIIKNADLEEIKALGSGTYGTVYYGKWRGSDVAIKRIKSSCFDGRPSERERLIADFWKEAYLLAQLHHPNVVAFYGVAPDGPGGTLATVTEYMVNGSLKQVLQRKDRTIDRRKRLLIAMDAAFGMEYLHGKNIVHFDLKCENLLVNMRDPQRPVCKVADLGLSKVKHKTMVSGGVRGTLPWMAPELLSPNSMVTEKVDVFSFGIMMWELLTGEEPYADMHQGAVIGGLVSGKLRPLVPAWCEPSWKSLMERCWSTDPKARPSFSEIASELRLMSASIQSRTQKANG